MGKFGNFLQSIAPGIPLVGGLIQSFMQGGQSRRNTDRTIAENRRQADLAYQRDMQMWNMNNEYNSPQMQMERLKAAGLNPNLVYGSGGVSGNSSAPSMPKYNAPTAQYNYSPMVDIPSSIAMYQDMQVKQAQYDNLREQNKVIRQNEAFKRWQNIYSARTIEPRVQGQTEITRGRDLSNTLLDQKRENITEMFPHQLDFAKGRIKYQDTQVTKMLQDMKRTEASTEFTKLQNEYYVTKMIGQFGLGILNSVSKFAPWKMAAGSLGKKGLSIPGRFSDATRSFNKRTDDLRRFGLR